jgi:hypothetical protein
MVEAESIFLNGHIYTLDGQNSITQAMATYEGRILAIGSIDKIKTLIGPLTKVVTNLPSISLDAQYSFDVLNVWSHAYDKRERKVLNDNEWFGWVHWMRNAFKEGTIKEHWKQIQRNEWFDPAFEDFMNKEIIAPIGKLNDEKAT